MEDLSDSTLAWICECADSRSAQADRRIQTLWSGYGEILRVRLTGSAIPDRQSVVLKRVAPPTAAKHPRGWNTSRSHERKLHSYEVERRFYDDFAARSRSRVPACLGSEHQDGRWLILLEDLDASGFAGRPASLTAAGLDACLHWLADFHASFLQAPSTGLWPVGTYWHLATRPDELAALSDERLRTAAPILDDRLSSCRYQTLVHGDAKLANFCFSGDQRSVAAVDFQYVGGGCGIKDVAYFLSSCMTESECEQQAEGCLDRYFGHLRLALADTDIEPAALEEEWRPLYGVAWADFYRFLAGWSPDHWKIHGYAERLTDQVLKEIL